jgi:hypothetical protein
MLGFILQNLNAQIINVETLRMKTDTLGWAGVAELSFSIKKNVNEQLDLNNHIHVQYKFPRHIILFMNKVSFSRVDDADFSNETMQHLRYNYKYNKKFTQEIFIQNQYNAISKIEYRRIAGLGIRWKMSSSENYRLYLGNSIMYETEKTQETIPIHSSDCRNSTYFSFTFKFSENAEWISTTYFQPKINQFVDYRLSHQSTLSLNLFKNLAFVTTFNYAFDAFPVEEIPKKEYELTNGLMYSFY